MPTTGPPIALPPPASAANSSFPDRISLCAVTNPQPAVVSLECAMARMVKCVKLGREAEGLDFLPYPGELGKRVFENVSKEA